MKMSEFKAKWRSLSRLARAGKSSGITRVVVVGKHTFIYADSYFVDAWGNLNFHVKKNGVSIPSGYADVGEIIDVIYPHEVDEK